MGGLLPNQLEWIYDWQHKSFEEGTMRTFKKNATCR